MEAAQARKAEDTTKSAHAAPDVALKLDRKADSGTTVGMPLFLQRSVVADLERDAQPEEDLSEVAPEEAAPEAEETDQLLQTKSLSHSLQRQEDNQAEEEIPLEATEEESPLLQPKLTVNPPNDDYEQEADQVAEAVVQRAALSGSRSDDPLPLSSAKPNIQRKCDACEAEEQAQSEPSEDEVVQRQASAPTEIDHQALPESIRPSDAGTPLPTGVKEKVEPVLGADLSAVRVHDRDEDRQVAHSLKAQAFTHKNHIWLGQNQRADDVKLMSHESAHVVQQTAGNEPIQRLQRKPADYQHPEDGGGVSARLRNRFQDEIPDQDERSPAATDSESTANANAERSRNQVDPAELRSRSAEVRGDTAPDVDRPAQEQPQIAQSAAAAQQEAESAPEALVEGEGTAAAEGSEGTENAGGEASSAAEQAAGLAQQAFAAAAAQPEPGPEVEVQPPSPVTPVDAAGEPLDADPDADSAVADIAGRIQYLREQGTAMRTQAAEGHANAEIIRGNIARVSGEVTKAEEGIATAQDHAQHRHEVIGQAESALGVSQEKQATVAAEAPSYQTKADEGKEDSGPMASEAGSLASENAANTPDDSEAAEKSQEQGQKINQVGDDAQTMDGAISQTRSRADSLVADAAHAAELNTQTQEKISAGQQVLDQTDQRLGQHEAQTGQARAQVEGMASAPNEVHAQANQLNDQGQQLIESSFAMESRLHQSQQRYATQMQGIPPVQPWQGETPGEGGVLQAQADTSQPSDGVPAAVPTPEPSAPPNASEDAIETGLEPGAEPAESEAAPEPASGVEPAAEGEAAGGGAGSAPDEAAAGDAASALAPAVEIGPRQDRSEIDSDVPPWVTGVDPESVASREDRRQQIEDQRSEEIDWFNQQLGGRSVAQIGAGERFGLVGRALSRRFQNILSNISWPGWGGLARMLLDPRSLLAGAVGGLGMILSGGANLFSLEQWQRDPLGNLLTSAANIATGLAVILGSITALAGLVAAIMGALILITFGAASPIALPVISVCTTIITTVGGWTIAVGKVALVLQALALIKNLIDVATAQTADDLQRETEEVSGNINGSFQAVMSIVGAKGAQAGLAGVRNRAAGVIRASRRAGGAGALARQTATRGAAAVGRGITAVGRGIVAGGRAVGRGVVAGGRAIGRGVVAGGRAIGRGVGSLGRRATQGVRDISSKIRTLGGRGLRQLRRRLGRGPHNPNDLVGISQSVRIGGRSHTLSIRRIGNRVAIYLCSGCRDVVDKIDDILENATDLPNHVRRQLVEIRARADGMDDLINRGHVPDADARAIIQGLKDELEDLVPGSTQRTPGSGRGTPTGGVDPLAPAGGAEHTSGARGSTAGRHEEGRARVARDRGGEAGDVRRPVPRRRPEGWKGPWPPHDES
ncbi:eCIS core domain-containing protein [Leptothoe sp. PORK10 BA2]|uniref:eCIS core domain-containing protein n=1 Tax=Leptothoe sp. PORK10 BA2 TaxID=3110254 RepID=UPI002B210E00|nr:DUF4157 domain-containing protein [Leptothoe sp. PORK10 BA2]MEA5463933.1 DUF4157 domain-containing protein [Leptothoe sp. PORK10 BA2]